MLERNCGQIIKMQNRRTEQKNVKLKFPAAIEIKGVVVQDKFPDWHEV